MPLLAAIPCRIDESDRCRNREPYCNMTAFSIPQSVTELHALAFYGATMPSAVSLGENLKYVDSTSFLNIQNTASFIADAGCIVVKAVDLRGFVQIVYAPWSHQSKEMKPHPARKLKQIQRCRFRNSDGNDRSQPCHIV